MAVKTNDLVVVHPFTGIPLRPRPDTPRRPRYGLALICAVLVAAACGGDGSGGAEDGAASVWSLEVVHEIGSLDDLDQTLTTIRTVVIGPEQELYVGQPDDGNIRVYGADEALLRTIGQRGEGPGEFGQLSQMGLNNGELWALDTGNGRLGWYSLQGEFLRSSSWRPDPIRYLPAMYLLDSPRGFAMIEDGNLIAWPSTIVAAQRRGVGPEPTVPDDMFTPIVRMTLPGVVLDTVALVDREVDDRPDETLLPALQSRSVYAAMSDGSGVVFVDRSIAGNPDPGTFRVARISIEGDTLFERAYPYTPISTPPGTVERYIEREVPEPLRERFADRVWAPETIPPVSVLTTTQDGTIWLAREAEGQDSVAWWALDPATGDHLGTIHLPPGHEIVAGRGDVLIAKRSDEFDVPYLVRYQVVR